MKRILNTIMVMSLMIAKVQGVYAQESLITTNTNTNSLISKIDNQIVSDPSIIASIITVNPYDFGRKKKVDQKMALYREEVEAERKRKEEERKKKEEEQRKAKILARYKVSTDSRTDFTGIYQAAAARFGLEWQLLRAVHLVETGGRGDTIVSSYAGAKGPMQFMPATFRAYSIDGDGDGVKNINDVDDAIFSAANYLAQNKAATDVRNALYRYNHSTTYIEKVLTLARSLGFSK